MKKLLLLSFAIFGFSYGFKLSVNNGSNQPLYYKKSITHEKPILNKLNKDFKLLYVFDIQKTMQAYDKNFIPYKVYIYNTKYTDELLEKHKELGNALPFSVLIYQDDGAKYIVIPNIKYEGMVLGIDNKSLKTLNEIQEDILKDVDIKNQNQNYKSIPIFITKAYNMDFNDAVVFIKSSLESNGMTVPHEYKIKNEDILYSCNAKWGRYILSDFKEIGAFAPCRIVIYQKDNKTYVSYFNPEILTNLNKNLKPTSLKAIKKLNNILNSSLSGF